MYVYIGKHLTMSSSLHAKKFSFMLVPKGSYIYIYLFTYLSIYLSIRGLTNHETVMFISLR